MSCMYLCTDDNLHRLLVNTVRKLNTIIKHYILFRLHWIVKKKRIEPTNKIWNFDCFLIVLYHPAINKQIHRYKKYKTTCILSILSISSTMMNLNNTLRLEPSISWMILCKIHLTLYVNSCIIYQMNLLSLLVLTWLYVSCLYWYWSFCCGRSFVRSCVAFPYVRIVSTTQYNDIRHFVVADNMWGHG